MKLVKFTVTEVTSRRETQLHENRLQKKFDYVPRANATKPFVRNLQFRPSLFVGKSRSLP
jgi:hypothetical protein